MLVPVLLHQWKSPTDTDNSMPVLGEEIKARYGLTNYLDVGIKSTNILSLLFDSKLQYINTKYFDAAADFAISWEPFPEVYSNNDIFFFSFDPNLLFSINFCKSYSLTFCYKQMYKLRDGAGLLYQAATITNHIGNNYKVIPEIGFLWNKEKLFSVLFAVGIDIQPISFLKNKQH